MTNTMSITVHGDPLFAVAIKGWDIKEVVEEEKEKEKVRSTMGHGDPLYQEVLRHDSKMHKPLHAEFLFGHGDPLMGEFMADMEEGRMAADNGIKHGIPPHSEFHKHGDPFYDAVMKTKHGKLAHERQFKPHGTHEDGHLPEHTFWFFPDVIGGKNK